MHHLVLLGDSTLDNAAYTDGGPSVIAHVQQLLPDGWCASLNALDGATTEDIPRQLAALPSDASHLLLSIGGNDALLGADVLDTPASSTAEALRLLHALAREFEPAYRQTVQACLDLKLPLVICTIYNGSFPDPDYQKRATVALTVFNDIILRVAVESRLRVIDFRLIGLTPEDYANPVDPNATGGGKIARAIVLAVTEPPHCARGANVVAG